MIELPHRASGPWLTPTDFILRYRHHCSIDLGVTLVDVPRGVKCELAVGQSRAGGNGSAVWGQSCIQTARGCAPVPTSRVHTVLSLYFSGKRNVCQFRIWNGINSQFQMEL